MSLIIALLLGFVQGIAEFLPISSSGHLILLGKIFGIQNDILSISIFLHFATLFAIIFVFRKYILEMIKNPLSKESVNLYIATLPTFLIVLFYKSYLEDIFTSSILLPLGFLVTALLLLFTYFISQKKEKKQSYLKEFTEIKKSSAILMGVAQGFAVLPGISRLGITFCTGILSGEKREDVTRFSFILSIPIVLASVVYDLVKGGGSIINTNQNIFPLFLSFMTAFCVGLISIQFILKVMKNGKYYWFALYLIVLSIVSFFII